MAYDPFTDARAQIDDGLGLRARPAPPISYNMPAGGPPQGPPAMRAPTPQVGQPVPAPQGAPNMGGNSPLQIGQFGARYNVGPLSAGVNYQPGAGVGGGVQYNQGPLSAGAGYDPRRGAYGDIALRQNFAKGGGVWTRKEGQNPEGGLNAAGRASLRAQGQDIKPPVSAKQAKKSPKAAARRKSFCARMGGMEGPMKDDKGRPTRKALALRKWDC